jgi:ribonuclease P/MRP protein subunit POP3
MASLQDDQVPDEWSENRFYSAIFVARSGQPNALSSHLPRMVAAASKSHPSQSPTRLVELPRGCEGRLSESLGVPRVSCIGICFGAPNSKALIDFTRRHVPIIEIPWLQEASQAEFRETRINTVETIIGAKKKTKDKSTQGGCF